jgi:hypothetical protein
VVFLQKGRYPWETGNIGKIGREIGKGDRGDREDKVGDREHREDKVGDREDRAGASPAPTIHVLCLVLPVHTCIRKDLNGSLFLSM